MRLAERKVIVTGGPTREWIDPVRFISNASSGKMGIALAAAAYRRSRETVFVHGPVADSLLETVPCRAVAVESTAEMLDAVTRELEPAAVLVMAAAPADYAPVRRAAEKIKKRDDRLVLELKKNPDILKEVAARAAEGKWPGLFTVGFAAETTDLEAYATAKLRDKRLDMICLNDVSAPNAGFGKDTNVLTLFFSDGSRRDLPCMTKAEAAERIFDEIETRLNRIGV